MNSLVQYMGKLNSHPMSTMPKTRKVRQIPEPPALVTSYKPLCKEAGGRQLAKQLGARVMAERDEVGLLVEGEASAWGTA